MEHNTQQTWIKAIRSYVYQMIALVTFLATIAMGYAAWHQQSSKQLETVANEFHLASSFHYLQAMQELRSMDDAPGTSRVSMWPDLNKRTERHLRATAGEKHYSTAFHLIRRDLEAGLALEKRYNDERTHFLESKLKRQLQDYTEHSEDYLTSFTDYSPIVNDIHSLLKTLDQLVRLHSASRDELLIQSRSQLKTRTSIFYALLSLLFIVGLSSTTRGLRAINTLISEHDRAANKVRHQAHYDSLTQLPNRLLSLNSLSQLVNEAKTNGDKVALLFLDLDDFKKVNDTLGHDIGDKLLVNASQRLRNTVRKGDFVGRLGGDEFVVMLGKLDNLADITPIAKNIIGQMRKPFKVDTREMRVTCSLGISIYPQDGTDPQDLLRNADSAMYHAKKSGRNTHTYFTESMNVEAQRRIALEEQILGALERNEFNVVFQPKVDLRTDEIMGAEALLRWHNPTLGHVTPDEFIPVAEHTGLIVPIGQYVLEQALQFTWRCNEECGIALHMAVNLSTRQFSDHSLVSSIAAALLRHHIAGEQLELEVTEGVLMNGGKHIADKLAQLSASGVKIAMDDFGTGYSSLSYLRAYPFDVIKIDRSFISDLGVDAGALALIEATISMAHALKLEVVAEGVETRQQLDQLTQLSCEYAQGYYIGKPMSDSDFLALLDSTAQQPQAVNSLRS